jgi:hypothetical protein
LCQCSRAKEFTDKKHLLKAEKFPLRLPVGALCWQRGSRRFF